MHKLYIIQRTDGSVLVVAVANPGAPADVVATAARKIKAGLADRDKVLAVPYATAVVVTQETLWQSVKAWWLAKKIKVSTTETVKTPKIGDWSGELYKR